LSSLFCRHNRFTADCPICSKGTVLDPERKAERPRAPRQVAVKRPGKRTTAAAGAAREFTGPYVSAGPYGDAGERYQVRLEKVPGGLRLASWQGGTIERRAPVLQALDLMRMIAEARERNLFVPRDIEALERAVAADAAEGESAQHGASPGRAGDLRDELRVEDAENGTLRIGRWIYRPGEREWELQEAPVMLPAKPYAPRLAAACWCAPQTPAASSQAAARASGPPRARTPARRRSP
jgi:hypothetical protein